MLVLKNTLIALATILVMDAIWLGYIAKPLYVKGLGEFMHIYESGVYINYLAAGVVYICLAIGISVFVIPKSDGQILNAMLWGGLFGLLVYTVYDMTNMSIMPKWPLWISIVDMVWGGVLSSVCAAVVTWVNGR